MLGTNAKMDELTSSMSRMNIDRNYRFIRNPAIFDYMPILTEDDLTRISRQLKMSLVKRELSNGSNEFILTDSCNFVIDVVVYSQPLESECGRNWHMKNPQSATGEYKW